MYTQTITVVLEHEALSAAELHSLVAAIRQLRGVSEVHVQPRHDARRAQLNRVSGAENLDLAATDPW